MRQHQVSDRQEGLRETRLETSRHLTFRDQEREQDEYSYIVDEIPMDEALQFSDWADEPPMPYDPDDYYDPDYEYELEEDRFNEGRYDYAYAKNLRNNWEDDLYMVPAFGRNTLPAPEPARTSWQRLYLDDDPFK